MYDWVYTFLITLYIEKQTCCNGNNIISNSRLINVDQLFYCGWIFLTEHSPTI